MNWFIYNIILAALFLLPVKILANPDLNKPLIFLGIYVGLYTLIWMATYFINRVYFFKVIKFLNLIGFFTRETVMSNFRVAYDVLTPGFITKPAIVAVPIDITTDAEIISLATAITLTPGTLALEISEDKKTMYVHEMYVPDLDPDEVRKNIKNGFEKKILELTN